VQLPKLNLILSSDAFEEDQFSAQSRARQAEHTFAPPQSAGLGRDRLAPDR
jgi:hypothetical protein